MPYPTFIQIFTLEGYLNTLPAKSLFSEKEIKFYCLADLTHYLPWVEQIILIEKHTQYFHLG